MIAAVKEKPQDDIFAGTPMGRAFKAAEDFAQACKLKKGSVVSFVAAMKEYQKFVSTLSPATDIEVPVREAMLQFDKINMISRSMGCDGRAKEIYAAMNAAFGQYENLIPAAAARMTDNVARRKHYEIPEAKDSDTERFVREIKKTHVILYNGVVNSLVGMLAHKEEAGIFSAR